MGKKPLDLRFWEIRNRKGRRRPYELRWVLAGREHSVSFKTKTLAQRFQSDLTEAAKDISTEWDLRTGQPAAWGRIEADWFSLGVKWVGKVWGDLAPNTRKSIASDLSEVTILAMLSNSPKARRSRPGLKVLRAALKQWAFCPGRAETPPAEIADALAWLKAHTLPVTDLAEIDQVRDALAKLGKLADGRKASTSTLRRRRGVLHSMLDYAVSTKIIKINTLAGIRGAHHRQGDVEVSPVRVPSMEQAVRLLSAVRDLKQPKTTKVPSRGPHLFAFFATMYYAGLRPSECLALKNIACDLPEAGWGLLTLTGAAPTVGKLWTDDGQLHDQRGLKHRHETAVRLVPIPPVLVRILRAHIAQFPPAPDGRVFYDGPDKAILKGNTYRCVWKRARRDALSAAEAASPVAQRPYDLRHANASVLLKARVDLAEIARRLGHSIKMLLVTYAHWIDDGREAANTAIEALLDLHSITSATSGNAPELHGPVTGQQAELSPVSR
ncbi:hypothetical protein DP939_42910 [Spongiactinospora rosea]|uniref:Integrase n=1 Tax=Spongiactinospora rosea TaxID=2248750 RepID=A0A366LJF9_9ACTN|nr:tyrosine-type recombinase/integrase [Spongiactinospora rosea]RBQ14028.1 hypothetical protein DP939_42910 [Spongiactinospora rosea]